MTGKTIDEVERMRKVAVERAAEGKFGIDPSYWFNTMTDKINLLKEVENRLSDDIVAKTGSLEKSAYGYLLFYIILSITLIALTALITYVTASGILRQLGGEPSEVVAIAQKVAGGDLTVSFGSAKATGLYAAMKDMVENLQGVVSNVMAASDAVTSASRT
jgi:methyl-accepting chemotaxis protein